MAESLSSLRQLRLDQARHYRHRVGKAMIDAIIEFFKGDGPFDPARQLEREYQIACLAEDRALSRLLQ
jgi:hypothetical protein